MVLKHLIDALYKVKINLSQEISILSLASLLLEISQSRAKFVDPLQSQDRENQLYVQKPKFRYTEFFKNLCQLNNTLLLTFSGIQQFPT